MMNLNLNNGPSPRWVQTRRASSRLQVLRGVNNLGNNSGTEFEVLLSHDTSSPGTYSGGIVEFTRLEAGDDRMTPLVRSKFLNRRIFKY